ncbi:MAG: hypothetical protein V8S24_02355 [Gordonibacter pamelaeae]
MRLTRPLLPVMALAVVLGVIGFAAAIFLTVFAAYALLGLAGLPQPVAAGVAARGARRCAASCAAPCATASSCATTTWPSASSRSCATACLRR